MSTLQAVAKVTGHSSGSPRVAIGVDANFNGSISDAERFALVHDAASETFRGHKSVETSTINMLVMVVYQLDAGAKLDIVVTKGGTTKVWEKSHTASSSAPGWVAGYLWY